MSDAPKSAAEAPGESDDARAPRDALDPRGLIRDAFAMPDLHEADCRSIFFDWALGTPDGTDYAAALETLKRRHADAPATHPMWRVLEEGAQRETDPARRGRRGRPRRES